MRRTFAAPLVLTLAVAPACTTVDHRTAQPSPPPTTAGDTADHRVPPPAPTGDTADHRTPPGPPQTAPAAGNTWTVFQKADGTCASSVDVVCHPGATCNPPAPQPYACPEGITAQRPMHIHQDTAGADCFLIPPQPECPAGVMCNPPPPRKVSCPG